VIQTACSSLIPLIPFFCLHISAYSAPRFLFFVVPNPIFLLFLSSACLFARLSHSGPFPFVGIAVSSTVREGTPKMPGPLASNEDRLRKQARHGTNSF